MSITIPYLIIVSQNTSIKISNQTKPKYLMNSDLFKLIFDDSGIRRVIDDIGKKLQIHDEQIEELQRLLKEEPSLSDLDKIRDDLQRSFEDKVNDLQKLYDDKVNNLQNHLDTLNDDLNKKFDDLHSETLANKVDLTPLNNSIEEINKKISTYESNIIKNADDINQTREFIQAQTNAYAGVMNKKAPLTDSLSSVLFDTTDFIKNKFKEMETMKKEIEELNNHGSRRIEVPLHNGDNNDITKLSLRGEFRPTIDMPPVLPKPSKFDKLPQAVDYIYELEPVIQGHMYAMHDAIIDILKKVNDIKEQESQKVSARSVDTQKAENKFDAILKRIQSALRNMSSDLDDLKKGVRSGLSKKEIIDLIEEALNNHEEPETDSSIGALKCLACGRDVNKVKGASLEIDALKTLGAPPNSIMFQSSFMTPGYIQNVFSSDIAFENSTGHIVESPRGSKTNRNSCRIVRKPKSP